PDAIYRDALNWAWRGGVDSDTFGDVPLHQPFFNEVTWLAQTGATQGYGADWWTATDTFRPAGAVTRQAMAAFLYRLSGETYEPNWWQQTFTDVPNWHPFWREIEWLATTGITTGYSDGTFQPGSTVTRQAMAAFLHRLAGEP